MKKSILNKIAVSVTLFFLSGHLFGQAPAWLPNYQTSNFTHAINSGDSLYQSTGEDTSNSQNYKSFSRWKRFWEPRLSSDGSPVLAYKSIAKLSNTSVCNGSSQYPNSWTNISSDIGKNFRGRIERAAIAPHNSNIAFAGSYHGGLWRTANFQDIDPIWTNVTDPLRMPGVGISGIAFDKDYNTNGTMYISTGRGDVGDNEYGMGLLKSTDWV